MGSLEHALGVGLTLAVLTSGCDSNSNQPPPVQLGTTTGGTGGGTTGGSTGGTGLGNFSAQPNLGVDVASTYAREATADGGGNGFLTSIAITATSSVDFECPGTLGPVDAGSGLVIAILITSNDSSGASGIVEGTYPLLAFGQSNPDGGIFATVVSYPNLLANGALDPNPGADVENGSLVIGSAIETQVSGSFSGTLTAFNLNGTVSASGTAVGSVSGTFSAPVCP